MTTSRNKTAYRGAFDWFVILDHLLPLLALALAHHHEAPVKLKIKQLEIH